MTGRCPVRKYRFAKPPLRMVGGGFAFVSTLLFQPLHVELANRQVLPADSTQPSIMDESCEL